MGPDDVTRALERLKSFHSSSSPTGDYNSDIEEVVMIYSTLDSATLDPFEVQHQMFDVVTRALAINLELAEAQPSPSEAAAGSRHDHASTASCVDDPPPKRRRLEPEPPSSPEDEAAPPVISCSDLAEDLAILAIGALDTGINTVKRSGCTQQTARAVLEHLFDLLNHDAFSDPEQHVVLQAAVLQSLNRIKDELIDFYDWAGLTQQRRAQQDEDQDAGGTNAPMPVAPMHRSRKGQVLGQAIARAGRRAASYQHHHLVCPTWCLMPSACCRPWPAAMSQECSGSQCLNLLCSSACWRCCSRCSRRVRT